MSALAERFSKRQKHGFGWVLFVSWLLLSSLALFRFGFSHYGEFDPELRWSATEPQLKLATLQIPDTRGWQLVHVLDSQCGCSRLAQQHVATLSQQLQLSASQQHYRSVAELAAVGFQLPAVPAVLVFEHGSLRYAGPYASGPLCSASNSFLPALLAGQSRLPGSWLNGETKACRCLVSPAT